MTNANDKKQWFLFIKEKRIVMSLIKYKGKNKRTVQ